MPSLDGVQAGAHEQGRGKVSTREEHLLQTGVSTFMREISNLTEREEIIAYFPL